MNKIALLSLAIFIFFLGIGSFYASETGEIEGKVVDESGNALPGVFIGAESPNDLRVRV